MNIEIANRLVNLRKTNGLSQEALAEKLGISRQAVSKWERAEASPDTDNLILLAKIYKISLDELLSSEEDPTPTSEPADANTIEPPNEKEDLRKFSGIHYPMLITAIYLTLGFLYQLWHPAWVLFLTIPLYYSLTRYLRQRKRIP